MPTQEYISLFLSPAGIGEVILQTPLYRALRSSFPAVQLTAVVARGNAPVLAHNPAIGRLLPFATPYDLFRVLYRLRDTTYDRCYVLDKTWKATYLARVLVRARRYIGFRRRAFEALPLTMAIPYDASRHETSYYLELVGMPDADPTPEVFPSEDDHRAAEQALAEWPCPVERTVCLCPGGARNPMVGDEPFRRWPVERYAELAVALAERGFGIVLIGSSSDRPINQAVAQAVAAKNAPVLDLAGRLPLLVSGLVAQKAALTITHDSGLMHLASCFCPKMLCLFGPTSPVSLRPRNQLAAFLWKDEDIYCPQTRIFGTRTLGQRQRKLCFQRLHVAEVLQKALVMLARHK